jgi:phosphotransacetylase
MTTAALKKKIKALIEAETDERKLSKVLTMLDRDITSKAMARRMQQVAEASERDIKAGRVMDLETFEKDTAEFINELFDGKENGRSAAARRSGASKAK